MASLRALGSDETNLRPIVRALMVSMCPLANCDRILLHAPLPQCEQHGPEPEKVQSVHENVERQVQIFEVADVLSSARPEQENPNLVRVVRAPDQADGDV